MNDSNTSNTSWCPPSAEWPCPNFNFANYFLVWVILGLFGTCGNILSIATLAKDSQRNVSSLLLTLLAVSDTIQIWANILIQSIRVLCAYRETEVTACYYDRYIFPYVWKYVRPIWFFAFFMSNWIIVLVTFHRTIAVTKPHKTRVLSSICRVRLQCLFVVLLSIIIAIPVIFESRIDWYPGCDPDIDVDFNMQFLEHPAYRYIHIHFLQNILGKILPVVLLFILTYLLIKVIRQGSKQGSFLGRTGPDILKQERQLTLLLIVVVLVFLVCQIPHVIVTYLTLYQEEEMLCPKPGYYAVALSDTLSVFNASINFALYCLIGKKFRRMLRELFWVCPATQTPVPTDDTARTRLTPLPQSPEANAAKMEFGAN